MFVLFKLTGQFQEKHSALVYMPVSLISYLYWEGWVEFFFPINTWCKGAKQWSMLWYEEKIYVMLEDILGDEAGIGR